MKEVRRQELQIVVIRKSFIRDNVLVYKQIN